MTNVRARTLFSDQKLTVRAVESLQLRIDRSDHARFLIGSLKPIAIIVTEPDRTYALDLDARPVDIDGLGLSADFSQE